MPRRWWSTDEATRPNRPDRLGLMEQLYYKMLSLSSQKGKIMTEKNSILELEKQANNTRQLVDRINKAMYGMTWEEHERLHGIRNQEKNPASDAEQNNGGGIH